MSDLPPEDQPPPEEPPDEPVPEEPEAPPDPAQEAAKWKALARKHEAAAKKGQEAQRRLADLENSNKTELEKATESAKSWQARAEAAELAMLKAEVAARKGLSPAQAKRLQGSTEEELEADADELAEAFKAEDKNGHRADRHPPKPRLRPGAVPDARPTERDPKKLAEMISRRTF
jgi:hypothetical protein